MCASYGLDPRFDDQAFRDVMDAAVLDGLRSWAAGNDGEVLRPTGKNLRNLNPLITAPDALEEAWWGYLVDGAPASFASINTRSERLARTTSTLPSRAIVPVSFWREMAKPSRVWQHFSAADHGLLGLAAVTRPGRTADGVEITCYSIVTRPAVSHLEHVHDRMPLLIGPDFAEQWMTAEGARGELIDAAVAASSVLSTEVRISSAEGDSVNRLF